MFREKSSLAALWVLVVINLLHLPLYGLAGYYVYTQLQGAQTTTPARLDNSPDTQPSASQQTPTPTSDSAAQPSESPVSDDNNSVAEEPSEQLPQRASLDDFNWVPSYRILGNLDPASPPKNWLVMFFDPLCGFCQKFYLESFDLLMSELTENKVVMYAHLLTVSSGNPTLLNTPVMALECAGKLGGANTFWQYLQRLKYEGLQQVNELVNAAKDLNLNEDAFRTCMRDTSVANALVQESDNVYARYPFRGTPAFILNGWGLVGAQPIDAFRPYINTDASTPAQSQ